MDLAFVQSVWDCLPYHHFPDRILSKLRGHWETKAIEILTALADNRNVGLVGDTGSGKTIVAILAALGLRSRTLFLAPTRYLVYDHGERFNRITGRPEEAVCFTGDTNAGKRDWNNSVRRLIFCTPETFWSDFRKHRIRDIRDFNLVIFDECHTVVGRKDSIWIAKVANDFKLPIIALTASPGGNIERIETIKSNCFINEFMRLEVPMPAKYENCLFVPMDETLRKIDHLFGELTVLLLLKLHRLGVHFDPTRTDIKSLKAIGLLKNWQEKTALAHLFYLHHAHWTAVTESYSTLLVYDSELQVRAVKSACIRDFLYHQHWQEIVSRARENEDDHPKIRAFVELVQERANLNQRMLVFVNNKETGRYLIRQLETAGIRADKVFGGRDRRTKLQRETLARLSAGELDVVIATSTLELGVSVPEVNVVVHYSLPMTETSRIQRSGRTGRFRSGEVIFLTMSHRFDEAIYWGVKKEERTMKNIVGGRMQTRPEPKRELPLFDGSFEPRLSRR